MNPAPVRSVPLFADITPKQRKAIAALADEVDVPAGEQPGVAERIYGADAARSMTAVQRPR
jgi:hypothetical protein